ncbi:hypothetical protein L5G28_08470 [Gordonia sp. HY285]|uniref:hypothetical protein n=1 Tax=Gordonia liuliyuniae TaxID=2911517 RepID=UPI001F3B07B4|nr:hypothetical protein [Gordonia liuliyuniae]MCF8610191.1 hypothetical protein [Gordonia liuliyuniae]
MSAPTGPRWAWSGSSACPDEVAFESLAACLRPMTLENDALGHQKVMDSLDALTDLTDDRIGRGNAKMRADWATATERHRNTRGGKARAYNVAVGDVSSPEAVDRATDLDLAYAWLYQDSVHGDLPDFDEFDARDRYQAAVHVCSGIAVVAIESLAYIRFLVEQGKLSLPEDAFTVDVVVTEPEWTLPGQAYVGDLGIDLSGTDMTQVPAGMKSIHELLGPSSTDRPDDDPVID